MTVVLEDFKNNIKNLLRPNRFSVEITTWLDQGQEYLIKGTTLPGTSSGEMTLSWQGYHLKVDGDIVYNDIIMHFYNNIDEESGTGIRDNFEEWRKLISNSENNKKSHFDSYKETIRINQLDRLGKIIKTYILYLAHPKEISDIELNMDSTDQVQEFTATFSYSYYTIEYPRGK